MNEIKKLNGRSNDAWELLDSAMTVRNMKKTNAVATRLRPVTMAFPGGMLLSFYGDADPMELLK